MANRPLLIPWFASASLAIALSGCSGSSSPTADALGDATQDAQDDADMGSISDSADSAYADGVDSADADGADSAYADGVDSADLAGPGTFVAEPGLRCAPSERIGRISIYGADYNGNTLNASAAIFDKPEPLSPSEPKLSDEACAFYQQPPNGFCGGCSAGEICAPDDTCQTLPVPAMDIVFTVQAGNQTQAFASEGSPSGAWGTLTLPGRTFSATVTWAGNTLTIPETTVPLNLLELKGTVVGGYDKPTGADLTWTPPEAPAQLFTNIPINHHAGGQTFTECVVEASSGSLHVAGDMLAPLAVITGLEFQGIEHVRFAAAKTPAGCIEVRFHVYQMVDLKY